MEKPENESKGGKFSPQKTNMSQISVDWRGHTLGKHFNKHTYVERSKKQANRLCAADTEAVRQKR